MKKWEKYPDYLRYIGFEPFEPDFCMVSDNLCKILNTKLDLPVNAVGSGGGGGGCTIRSGASVDSSWLLIIIGFGIGFMRQRIIKH